MNLTKRMAASMFFEYLLIPNCQPPMVPFPVPGVSPGNAETPNTLAKFVFLVFLTAFGQFLMNATFPVAHNAYASLSLAVITVSGDIQPTHLLTLSRTE